jgi:uncharacterized protein
MTIWVDADSCPTRIRRIIEEGADRTGFPVIFVADRPISFSKEMVKMITVPGGPDSADNYIVESSSEGDLVITRDIPLADQVISKGCTVLDDRGNLFTEENIRERLSLRNFMQHLRNTGIPCAGKGPLSNREIASFAAAFDRFLTLKLKES